MLGGQACIIGRNKKMSTLFNITNIWKHIRSGRNPRKLPGIDSRVSFAEINQFNSDLNFRQYCKTEAPERYEVLNDLARIKFEMIHNNHFNSMK